MKEKLYLLIFLVCISCSPSAKRGAEDALGHPLMRDPSIYLTKAHNTIYNEKGELKLLVARNDVLYAKDYIELYLKERPKDTKALRVHADVYRLLGKLDDTIAIYKQIIELNDKNPESYFDLGEAYFEAKSYYKASFSYKDAINYAPEFEPNYYFALALSYEKLNQTDLAKENFLITQECDPLNEEAKQKASFFVALDEFSGIMQEQKDALRNCLLDTTKPKAKEPRIKILNASVATAPPNTVTVFIKEMDTIDSQSKSCIDKIIEDFDYDYLETIPVEFEYSLDLTDTKSSNEKA
jgi:tetratricopeptide (TPR) repeat protein